VAATDTQQTIAVGTDLEQGTTTDHEQQASDKAMKPIKLMGS
jgi:hypothetical protein